MATRLGVGRVVVKDEHERLGLPSFKPLGSSWALHERVRRETGAPDKNLSLEEMRSYLTEVKATLCTASDGNYGHSIAAIASLMGIASVVFLPHGTAPSRIASVKKSGARVELIEGSYDDTVAVARSTAASLGFWYCPDTASASDSPESTLFVADVADGYLTLFDEMLEQLGDQPDVLFIQAGVGGLAASALTMLDATCPASRLVTVEPMGSNCVQRSLAVGEPVDVADSHTTMAGLRCQSVSSVAWPIVRDRATAAIAITDLEAARATQALALAGVFAGESGAAGLGGAIRALTNEEARSQLGIDDKSKIAVVSTEGITDPESYARSIAAAKS